MFASRVGRKMFFCIMLFSWVALLYPWIFAKSFDDRYFAWIIFPPYLPVLMALLLFLCFNKLKGRGWKISFSVLTEILLISIPILCFWPMMLSLYMILKYENIVRLGSSVTYQHWINFALVCIPIFAFPILRRWNKEEV